MSPIQTLADELQAKGYGPGHPVTEATLRLDYALPNWVGIPPTFVALLNEHLGTVTVGPEQDPAPQNDPATGQSASPDGAEPDIFSMFVDLLGGFNGPKKGS